jgi:hypothetical protein
MDMQKRRPQIDSDDPRAQPPPFLCQDRQCYGPMMIRPYSAEGGQIPDEHFESEDLREDIPVKKKAR